MSKITNKKSLKLQQNQQYKSNIIVTSQMIKISFIKILLS